MGLKAARRNCTPSPTPEVWRPWRGFPLWPRTRAIGFILPGFRRDGSVTDAGLVDYSDPRNQLRKLNSLINGSKDAGETLDALKVMISKQSDLAPEKKTEPPVRVYVPLSCDACPLYKDAKAKLNRK